MPQTSPQPCKHTVVRIVSRNEDAEFVECQSCGEIFDSIEYEDMAREEAALTEDEDSAAPPPRPARPARSGKPNSSRRR